MSKFRDAISAGRKEGQDSIKRQEAKIKSEQDRQSAETQEAIDWLSKTLIPFLHKVQAEIKDGGEHIMDVGSVVAEIPMHSVSFQFHSQKTTSIPYKFGVIKSAAKLYRDTNQPILLGEIRDITETRLEEVVLQTLKDFGNKTAKE